MKLLVIFGALQVADILSTLAAFHLGGCELNPLVQAFLHVGPVTGLLLSKLVICAIAFAAHASGRTRVLRLASFGFGCIVAWNLSIVFRLMMRG